MLQWLPNNKYLKAAFLLGAILVAVFLFSGTVNAQSVASQNSTLNQGVQIIQQPLGLANLDIRTIIANIVKWLLGLIGIILVVLLMYAGYLWMTAGGNDEQITQAKSIMRNAAIGLAIILSAYAIVAFILNMLGINSGLGINGDINPPVTENLAGSGALGRTIKDHYPARDQKDVPRNTKIVISFFKPILPSSFIVDTNGDNILGDCVSTTDTNFDWNLNCDHVTTTASGLLSDDFINVKVASTSQPIVGLVALVSTSSYNGVDGVYTLVLKPITDTSAKSGGYLGSETEDVQYNVHLGKLMRIDDQLNGNPTLFKMPGGADINDDTNTNNYNWNFTCNTTLDLTPPFVTGFYPTTSTVQSKNTVIQISFSEPVDPIGLQGAMQSTTGYFFLTANNSNGLYLTNGSTNILPQGSWNLVNNFQTLEFTPSQQCGKNVCGDPIYCLPVCNANSAGCTQDSTTTYKILLKTASTTGAGFTDVPFSGIEDLASNALDGNNNKTRQNPTTTLPIFDNWKTPDNYLGNFTINNTIDLTPPYLTHVEPGVIEGNVAPDAPWKMIFSKRMRLDSLYGSSIDVNEYPVPTNSVFLWKDPHALSPDYQLVNVSHGPFLKVVNKMYMPIVSSSVQDSGFNCFYPGLGPKTGGLTQNCDPATNGSCCSVTDTPGNNFCCNGNPIDSSGGAGNCQNASISTYSTN